MESFENIERPPHAPEGIDLQKLLSILRNNWIWILLIFTITNLVAYLVIRYTKNIYESVSEIKLDIKSEASEFGIKNVIEEQPINIISGEIEMIQSKLFLNRVLDQTSNFDISFISMGRVLSEELYGNAPAQVTVLNKKHSLYNVPIYFNELSPTTYRLQAGEQGSLVEATYGKKVTLGDAEMILSRNNNFSKGDELGYYFTLNDRDVLLNYISANLTVEPLNFDANTIRISFKDHNPQKAQTILNKIDSIYLQYSNEQKNLANKQKIDWVTNELKLIEARMEDYETYFETFMLQNKTNDLAKDFQYTVSQINKLDSQTYELTRRIREADALVSSVNSNSYIIPIGIRTILPDVLSKDIDRLAELQLAHEKLKLSHSEITFTYREKEREVQTVKEKTLEQINKLQSEWRKRLQETLQRKGIFEKQFTAFPDKNTEFTKNQRFYKLYEEFYLSLMQSKSEFEIAQAGTIPDFKILSSASFPRAPIFPNRWMILGVGMVAGIVFNFFFIGILYLLNNKITGLSELERGGNAPVLGAIPTVRYVSEGNLHILEHPKSMVSEAMRTLRTNIDFFNFASKQKVIAISSTVSGEGKSFIAMNLGGAIALSKKKVVLVDLDMRKPKNKKPIATVDESKGVSTVLIRKHNWQDCVIKTTLDNFDFIPAGPHPPNPSELLLNGEFSDMITELKDSYDYIILDTPPVGLVTDGIMAMKRADLSIYVFRANYSKKDFMSHVRRLIMLNKFTNITTILNALPSSGRTYGYGYYEENRKSKKQSKSIVES